jgi:hypothetical protein
MCYHDAVAQPGFCYPGFGSSTFSPLRPCNPSYISEEFVLLGKVISRDTRITPVKGTWHGVVKSRVEVEIPIKGTLAREVDLFLDWSCYESVAIGEDRIFTAKRITTPDFEGVISNQWSSSLKEISKKDLADIIKEIRGVTKGIKQPRVIGKIVQYDSEPTASPGFWGGYLKTKLGFDPKQSRPLAGIEVVAKRTDDKLDSGKQKSYKTKTNSDGNYKFKDLPVGIYELYPAVPKEMFVRSYTFESHPIGGPLYEKSFKSPIQGEKTYVRVGDEFCSIDVRFNIMRIPIE